MAKKGIVSSNNILIPLALVALIVVGVAAYLVGSKSITSNAPTNQAEVKNSSVFVSQEAHLQGKIVNVTPSSVAVVSDQGQSVEFSLDNHFVVYIPNPKSSTALASSDTSKIIKNQEALLNLELKNNIYVVTSISYLPTNSPSPASK